MHLPDLGKDTYIECFERKMHCGEVVSFSNICTLLLDIKYYTDYTQNYIRMYEIFEIILILDFILEGKALKITQYGSILRTSA